jgi:hypothetical protein
MSRRVANEAVVSCARTDASRATAATISRLRETMEPSVNTEPPGGMTVSPIVVLDLTRRPHRVRHDDTLVDVIISP